MDLDVETIEDVVPALREAAEAYELDAKEVKKLGHAAEGRLWFQVSQILNKSATEIEKLLDAEESDIIDVQSKKVG